jgi:hypothetical protein
VRVWVLGFNFEIESVLIKIPLNDGAVIFSTFNSFTKESDFVNESNKSESAGWPWVQIEKINAAIIKKLLNNRDIFLKIDFIFI